jgi:hypothetical protein
MRRLMSGTVQRDNASTIVDVSLSDFFDTTLVYEVIYLIRCVPAG